MNQKGKQMTGGLRVALALVLALLLSGCGTVVIGSITLGQLSTAAGVASVGATGKGLPDHALSAVTGRDCRLLEGIMRADRVVCEMPGSPATDDDFKGVVAMLQGDDDTSSDGQPEVLYAGLQSDFRPILGRAERQRPAIVVAKERTAAAINLPSPRAWAERRPAPTLDLAYLDGR